MFYVVLRSIFGNQLALWSNVNESQKGPLIFKTMSDAKKYVKRMSRRARCAANFIPQPMLLDTIVTFAIKKKMETLWFYDNGYARVELKVVPA